MVLSKKWGEHYTKNIEVRIFKKEMFSYLFSVDTHLEHHHVHMVMFYVSTYSSVYRW